MMDEACERPLPKRAPIAESIPDKVRQVAYASQPHHLDTTFDTRTYLNL
jgi:hypothetical protein